MGSLKDYKFWLNLFLDKEKNFSYKEYLLSSFGVLGSKIKTFLKTISGTILSFDDGLAKPAVSLITHIEPVQDLHGYDSPWPAGGGKNKINAPDVTLTNNGYVFNLSGLSIPSGTYTLSYKSDVQTTPSLGVSGANGDYINQSITNPFTFTVDGEITGIRMYSGAGTYSQIQLESGSLSTSYAPYSNICPITGHTEANVMRTGKNLLDKLHPSETGHAFAFSGGEAKKIVNSGWVLSNYMPVVPGYVYNFSGMSTTYNTNTTIIEWDDNHKSFISYQTIRDSNIYTSGATMTAPVGAKYCRVTYKSSDGTIQFKQEATATAYEPYQGETYSITFPTEAGTVYGGYVDVTRGKLVVDRAMVDLGMLTWRYRNTGYKSKPFCAPLVNALLPPASSIMIPAKCSQYRQLPPNQTNLASADKVYAIGHYYSANEEIQIIDNDYTDAAIFKTAMNGVQLVYELATPIEYDITPQQIELLKGYNNVWNNTDGNNELTYIGTKKGN